MANDFDPSSLSRAARQMFADSPFPVAKLQEWRPIICPFEKLLRHVLPGTSVLDIGCGNGLFLGLLVSKGYAISGVGFDTAPLVIERARKMAARLARASLPGTLRFQHVRVSDPWPQGPYDAVCMIDVIHHVPPAARKAFFQQAVSMVAPGGVLIFKDMCSRPRWRALANFLHDAVIAWELIHHLPVADAERWAADAGLALIHKEDFTRLWYGHELRVFRRPALPE